VGLLAVLEIHRRAQAVQGDGGRQAEVQVRAAPRADTEPLPVVLDRGAAPRLELDL